MSTVTPSRLQFEWLRYPMVHDADAINRLLHQYLSAESPDTTLGLIIAMIKDGASIACLRDANKTIQGVGALVRARDFYGLFGIIESVVVHPSFRKRGYGQYLMENLIAQARSHNYQRLQLTSKPERIAANALYQSLGFALIETNVYRLRLHST